jgi:starch-binding outer membrane protein, SusD/RagB family
MLILFARSASFAILATVVLVGCGDITNAGPNGLTQPSQYDNAQGAELRRNAALAAFATAQGEQVTWSGLIADELTAIQSQYEPVDALHISPANVNNTYAYGDLTNARLDALRAIQSLERYSPTPGSQIGQLFAYAGLVEVYFGEDMCSGVPLAQIVNDLPANDAIFSRQAILEKAVADFDSAASHTDSMGVVDSQLVQLAHVATGRALLDLGQFSQAATAVTGVPGSFSYFNDNFDGNLQYNWAWFFVNQNNFLTVADREGHNGLPFISAGDPRVDVENLGAPDGTDTVYAFAPYATATAPIVLASGVEASLIRAEAALAAGEIVAWSDTLNALRATVSGLPPLPADSTTQASSTLQQSVMFRERAFWLFLTGHRHGDLRRSIRQYGRSITAVFPTGVYPRSGGGISYGTDVTFVPVGEGGNPSFVGCDRAP